jgi:hypothetical protein
MQQLVVPFCPRFSRLRGKEVVWAYSLATWLFLDRYQSRGGNEPCVIHSHEINRAPLDCRYESTRKMNCDTRGLSRPLTLTTL